MSTLQFVSQKSVTIPSGTATCSFPIAGRFYLNEGGFLRRTFRRDDGSRIGEAAKSRHWSRLEGESGSTDNIAGYD
jgi:hypothetical protein